MHFSRIFRSPTYPSHRSRSRYSALPFISRIVSTAPTSVQMAFLVWDSRASRLSVLLLSSITLRTRVLYLTIHSGSTSPTMAQSCTLAELMTNFTRETLSTYHSPKRKYLGYDRAERYLRIDINYHTLQGYWQLSFDGLYLGGQQIAGSMGSVVDTGTTLLIGDTKTVKALYKQIKGSADIGGGLFSCTYMRQHSCVTERLIKSLFTSSLHVQHLNLIAV